ncbi:MAG TPA: lipopolysaccharide heptosyltransferase II [Mariprofundaceae bacterium]|nr:lipopolysaccharide heptosyltransferase II [Mariprofundaceae bacterium]
MSRSEHVVFMPPNWIGDVIMAQPAMLAIAEHHHDAVISVCGRSWLQDLIPYLGIDRASYEPSLPQADIAYLFPNSFRSAWQCCQAGIRQRIGYRGQWRRFLLTRPLPHRLSLKNQHHRLFYLDIANQMGIPVSSSDVKLSAPAGALEEGRNIMARHGLDPERVICLAPGAQFGGAKCYPAACYAEVAETLSAAGWQILILGMDNDRDTGETILQGVKTAHWNAAGQTSLGQALQLIAACRLMLCNDSGFMHVAAGLGKPTVAPFGATDPERTSPSGAHVQIIYRPAACSPCLQRECHVAGHPCMTNIAPHLLANACLAMLPHP